MPPPPSRREWWGRWYVGLAAGALIVYIGVGLWMLYGADYAIGDAIARASSARSIAHSRDQHLMAVGFYWAPGPVFAQVPFMAVLSRLGRPDWAIVFPTAVATAATIPVVARIAEYLGVARRPAQILVGLFAFNPYTVFFAGSGMSEPWFVLCFAGAVAAYLRWTIDRRTRDLGLLGAWLAFAQMTRHENLAVAAVMAAAVAWQSPKGRRMQAGVVTALPTIFYLVVWTAVSIAIINTPWWTTISAERDASTTLSNQVLQGQNTFTRVFGYTAQLCLRMAPVFVAVILLGGLLNECVSQLRRSAARRPPLLLAPIVASAAVFPAATFQLLLQKSSYGDPRYYTPLVAGGVLASLITLRQHRSELLAVSGGRRGQRRSSSKYTVVLIALSTLGSVTTLATIADARLSSVTGEAAVVRRLLTRDEAGVAGRGRTDQWRQFAAALDQVIGANDKVVLDTAAAHPVFLYTRHPLQTTTDRDKDSEALLARANPGFTVAVVTPGGRSQMSVSIREMIASAPAGFRWTKVDTPNVDWNLGRPEIWKLTSSDTAAPARSNPVPSQLPTTTRLPASPVTSGPAPTQQDEREDS